MSGDPWPYSELAGRDVVVAFAGGPWDGDEIEGLLARLIIQHEPEFVCVYADGRDEHYELAERQGGYDGPPEAFGYVYQGPCRSVEDHEDDGHEHEDRPHGAH